MGLLLLWQDWLPVCRAWSSSRSTVIKDSKLSLATGMYLVVHSWVWWIRIGTPYGYCISNQFSKTNWPLRLLEFFACVFWFAEPLCPQRELLGIVPYHRSWYYGLFAWHVLTCPCFLLPFYHLDNFYFYVWVGCGHSPTRCGLSPAWVWLILRRT